MTIFCQYRASGLGFCGMYLKTEEEVLKGRCKRHFKSVSKKKISSPKFRGRSKSEFQSDGWKGAIE